MNIKHLSPEEFTVIYNTHMVKDFPEDELKPLKRILYTMSRGLCSSFGLYAADNALIGYAVFIIPSDYEYALLDYFAIVKDFRGTGLGHEFFSELKPFFNREFNIVKGIFIECEAILRACDNTQKAIRKKRVDFYLKNGAFSTLLGSRLFGVEYEILYFPLESLDDAPALVHRRHLNYIYKKMFTPKHYKQCINLWERLGTAALSISAKKLAPYLLGKLICRNIDGKIIKYRITETECYCGEEDTACHAHRGMTERTKLLYEKGGTAYIYLCYGMHNLFNVVSGCTGHPEAVLIRGVEGFYGPGRLTKALCIDRSLNGADLAVSELLWLEDDGTKVSFQRGKRIGIDYATPKYRNILWRYYTS